MVQTYGIRDLILCVSKFVAQLSQGIGRIDTSAAAANVHHRWAAHYRGEAVVFTNQDAWCHTIVAINLAFLRGSWLELTDLLQ